MSEPRTILIPALIRVYATYIVVGVLPVLSLFAGACRHNPQAIPAPPPVVNRDAITGIQRSSSVDLSLMDRSIPPGDDFYSFANGSWLKTAPRQDGCESYGYYDIADERIMADLLSIMQPAADDLDTDHLGELVQTLFLSGIDAETIDDAGLSALAPELAAIDAIEDKEGLSQVLAQLQLIGVTPWFRIHRPANWELSGTNYLYLRQTALGLADGQILGRESDERAVRAYREFMTATFQRVGETQETAASLASAIVTMERRLAALAMTTSELRDFKKNYNLYSARKLGRLVPGPDWPVFFGAMGVEKASEVVIGQPEYFREVGRVIQQRDWRLIRAYLKWALLLECSPFLSSEFQLAHLEFKKQVGGNTDHVASRELTVAKVVNAEAPDAVGYLYVHDFLPEPTQSRVHAIIANLKAAFHYRILNNEWLSKATKSKALAKLAAITFKIGGPANRPSYSGVSLARDSFLRNVFQIRQSRMREHIGRIGQPLDRDGCRVHAQSSNCWYGPSNNSITLTAGCISSLFRLDADDARNYATLGTSIAHEMTHAFDAQGRLYDERGRRRNWWSWREIAEFNRKTKNLVDYYGSFSVPDGRHVDGSKTLDENIADLGGLAIAFDAYVLSLGGREAPVKDGFSGRQRFFLAFAQKWRETFSQCALEARLMGWHAPPRFRVNGPLFNFSGFYEAFPDAVSGQSSLFGDERISIW